MIQCQNCGRVNNYGSNFCRFCGTKFLVNPVSNESEFENTPAPPPYSWKTDEFQVAAEPTRVKPKTNNQFQPPFQQRSAAFAPLHPPPQPFRPAMPPPPFQPPLVQQNWQQQNLAQGYNCPRCAGQFVKYEKKISTAGWIVFAVLMVVFFPLFWIGLLIKEDVPICQTCHFRLS